ncbi:MAG: DsbA family protein, partial [Pseudomonadota bacterium]
MSATIHLFFDPICPWCYIGKVRLDRALMQTKLHTDIIMYPFQLNPDMVENGVDRTQYLENKFGGKDGVARVYGHIKDTGQSDGISFRFDLIVKTPNTVKAHMLVAYVQDVQKDVVPDLVASLYRAYFEQGVDIGNEEALLAIASAHMDDAMLTAT